jgi:hypothetical protein
MPLNTLITTFFAIWFGLGVGLGPRFLCICSDGTTTTQFGEQFCCDGPGEAPCPTSPERSDDLNYCVGSVDGGCQSTTVESESIVAVDRHEKNTDEDRSLDGPDELLLPWMDTLVTLSRGATSTHRALVVLDVGTSASHLRTVILLV